MLPIMSMLYISFSPPKLVTRLWHLGVAGAVTAISTLWWSVLVWLTPAANRPWVGSTNDNNIWSLIFGYNGFGRLFGHGSGPGGGAPGGGRVANMAQIGTQAVQSAQMTPLTGGGLGAGGRGGGPGGVGFGGETGVLRIFNESFGPNIAWLILVALISAGLVIWLLRRAPRHNKERVGVLLWLGWLLMHVVIFSMTSGTIHPYYVVSMAPAVAALVGIGVPYIWQAYTRRTKVAWILPLSIALTTILSIIMLGYSNYWPWLMWLVMIAGGVATILTLLPLLQTKRLKQIILGLAITAGMAAPIIFSVSTVATAHSGSIPTAGPGASAMSNTNNESARAESTLVSFLLENRHGTTWLAAVNSANESAPIQLSSGQPVMAIGGFSVSDSTLTLPQFKQLVKQGKVRYYVVNSRQGKSGGPSGMGGPGSNSEILTWVKSAGSKVDYGGTQYTVYDLAVAA